MAATMEVILESGQAQQGIDTLNKGFAKVDLSVRRLEKTMQRIEQSINKIVNPIRALAKSFVALNNLTGGYAKQIDFITKANKDLSDQLKKSKDDLRKTAENLARKAKALNVATKAIEKMDKASEKAGTKLMVFNRNLGAVNYALKRLSFNLKTGEYMFSVITQAIASFIAQNVVGYLIRMTDQFKLMESRLRIVNSNFATLNTNLRSTVSVALETRQSLFAIGNLMARIGRNSQELKTDTLQLAKATSTISKAFQIAGATAEEARNAIVQLSQALASGRLQGDELRSILELAPTLAESISKSIGITVGQLREFAREGLITTQIMLSAVAQSTKEINDNFKNIRPTVSQSITNVQTAMQAVLGFNDSFKKANDALARTFLNLALYIQRFADDSEKVNVVADFVRKLSENLIPLAAAVITAAKNLAIYVAAVYAADKALKILAATSQVYATAMAIANAVTLANPVAGMAKAIGELIKVFVQLSVIAFGLKEISESFEDTKNAVGLLADNTRTYGETLEYAETKIKKINEEAIKFKKNSLTPLEEITIKWQELTQAIQNSNEAILELDDRIKSAQKELKEFAGSSKEEFRNTMADFERGFTAFIEMAGSGIKILFNLITLTFRGAAARINGLIGLGKKLADLVTPDVVEDFFGFENAKGAEKYFSRMREGMEGVKQDFKDMNDAADTFMKSIDMDYSKRKTPITDMMLGKSVEDRQKEILTLQEKMSVEQNKLNELNEKGKNILKDELGRSPRDIILASMKSQQQSLIKSYRLQADLARREFEMAFDSPLDVKFAPVQSSISNFALGFQKDFKSFISTITKEFGLDEKGNQIETAFDKIFNLSNKNSPFRAENFFEAAKNSGFIDSNGKINIDSSGIAKIFQLDENFLDKVLKDPSIKKEIGKVEAMDGKSLIPDQLKLKLKELLEKYAASITEGVLSATAQIRSRLVTDLFAEQEDSAKGNEQVRILKLTSTMGNKFVDVLKKQNIELESQVQMETALYLKRLAASNVDINSDDVKRVIAAKNANLELNKVLNEQIQLNELNSKIVSSQEKLTAMDIESKLISEGNTGLQLQKRIREEIRNLEIKALDQALETGDISKELYDTTKRMLELKDSLLDKEEQITEQIRIQKDLQRTREEIARDRLIDEAKSRGRDISEDMSWFDRLKAGFGAMKDPGKKFAQLQEEMINRAFDIDIPTGAMIFDRGAGGITIDPNKLRALKGEAADSLLELYSTQIQQMKEEFSRTEREAGRPSSYIDLLLGGSSFRPKEREYPLQRKDGGILKYSLGGSFGGGSVKGPSHESGGVKGFLYGQPIELEGGEFVISKAAVAKYGVDLFDKLNSRRFDNGGSLSDSGFRYDELVDMKYSLFDRIKGKGVSLTYRGTNDDEKDFYAYYNPKDNSIVLNEKYYGGKYSEGSLGLLSEVQTLSHELLHATNELSSRHVDSIIQTDNYKNMKKHIRGENKNFINTLGELEYKDEQDIILNASKSINDKKYNSELLNLYDQKVASKIIEKSGIDKSKSELFTFARSFNLKSEKEKQGLIQDINDLMTHYGGGSKINKDAISSIRLNKFVNYDDIGDLKNPGTTHTKNYINRTSNQHVSEGDASRIRYGTEEIMADVYSKFITDKYLSYLFPDLYKEISNAYGDVKYKSPLQGKKESKWYNPFSWFQKGGSVKGASHAKGGVKGFLYGQPIELEGGEYVISKDAVAKYGMPLFESLNAGRFEPRKFKPGGPTTEQLYSHANKAMQAGDMALYNKLVKAIDERVKKDRAENYAKKGIATFYSDGTIIGDANKYIKIEKEKEKVALANANLEVVKLDENLKKANKVIKQDFNQNLITTTDNTKELTEAEIQKIESTLKMNSAQEELSQNQIDANKAIAGVTAKYKDIAIDWKTLSKEELEAGFGYSSGAGFSYGDVGGATAGPTGFIGSIYAEALGKDSKFEEFGEDVTSAFGDIQNLFANGFAEPMTGLITVTAKRLLQNERFQKALERFMDIFYVLFDEFAEGLALFFEAIVDALSPLKPLMQMVGGALKGIMRAFTQIIQPFAMLIESLQPILIYLSGFLQIIVGIFSSIVGGIASIFTKLFTNVLSIFGIDAQGYKSLNLLRQEKDILTEINSTIGDLSNSLGDIKDVIFEIMNSALNLAAPSVKLELATEKYNELFLAATSINASEEDISEFQNFAKTYLQQAQDVLKSSSAYQQIYARVIGDLEGIQSTLGADIGYEFTTKMKEAIFNLRLAGSSIADELVKATDAYQDGTLSFTDLATYVNFKLSQVEKDINLKDMADFGSLGDFTEVSQAYEDYLSDQFGRFEQAMGNAISNSSFEEDLAFLFGITPEGGVAAGATTKFVDIGGTTYEIPVGVTESEAFIATASGRSLSRQPELGDIQQAPDITQDRFTGIEPPSLGEGVDLAEILKKLLSGIWDALVKAIENIIGTFAEFLDAVFGWISDLGITAKEFLEDLFGKLFSGARTALEAIGDFFSEVLDLDQLPDAFGALGKFFESILNLDNLPDAFGALGKFFDDIISGTGISDAVTALGEFFSEIFGFESGLTATKVLEELFDSLFSGTRTAAEAIGDFFDDILGTGSRSPFQALGDFFDEILGTGSRSVSQALSDFFTKTISGTALDVSSALSDFFNRIVSGSALGISDFIDEFLGNLFSGSASAEVIIQGVFDQAASLLESIQLFKNPFYDAVGPKYLIEFASGGFLEGPSHKEGGIKAGVNGNGMVELEGGEYIINKKTVQSMGVPFFEFMNSLNSPSDLDVIGGLPSFQEFLSPFRNSVNQNKDILRFDDGGFFGMDLKKYSSSDFSFNTDDLFNSAKNMLDVIDIRKNSAFTSKPNPNNSKHTPKSKKDPKRWVEPLNWIPQMNIFDFEMGTKGWLKKLIGDHEFKLSFDFPADGVSAKIPGIGEFEKGGVIPSFDDGGPVKDVGDFFISTEGRKDAKTMSAYESDGSLRETRLADNLKYSFEQNKAFTDLDFGALGLPDWISTPLTNIIKGTLGSGQNLAGWFFDAIGGLGGTIKDSLSVFDPFAFLKGEGSSIKDQLGVLETFIMGMALYFFTSAFAGPNSPIYPGFLGMNPGQLGLTGLLSLFLLTERPQKDIDKYNKYGGGIGTNSYADLMEIWIEGAGGVPSDLKNVFVDSLGVDDTVGWLLLLATIMGGNYLSQRATGSSPYKAKKAFNPATYVPFYLKEDGGVIEGGLATGPSHASGMLGLTQDGSPFLFEGGEYIMSREAVSNIGVSTLDQMNFGKGGAIANEMFDISGGSTKYGQLILIADYVDLGNITAGVANNYFDHKYLDRMVTGSLKSDYESFGNGGSLRSFASGEAVGPSHQSGMLGMTPDGSPFLFEGGEYIINRKSAEKIGMDGLNALNTMGSGGLIREFADSGWPTSSSGTSYLEVDDYDILSGFTDLFKMDRAKAKREQPWYSKAWDGFKSGFGSAAKGLGSFANWLFPDMGKRTVFGSPGNAIATMLALSALPMIFTSKPDDPKTKEDEFEESPFNSIFTGRLGKKDEFTILATLLSLGWLGYKGYGVATGQMSWFGNGGSLPEFKRSNWVSESGMSVLRADWIRDVFGKRKIASDNARSNAAFASNTLGILGLVGSGLAGGMSLMYLSEFLGMGEKDPETGKSNKGNFGALLGSLLLGGLSASLWKWSDPFGGRSYGSGGGIPEFATSGEIARKKAFERGMFEISAGRDVSRSRAFRTDGGMNSSDSGMGLGGYLLALGVLGALYNNRNAFGSMSSSPKKPKMKNNDPMMLLLQAASLYSLYDASTGFFGSDNKFSMKKGLSRNPAAYLGGSLLFNAMVFGMMGEGGGIPEFGRGSFPFLGKKSNVAPEAALMIVSMFGAGALDYYSGREGVRGTREGLKIQNYGQLLGSIGLLAGGYLGSKKEPDSAFGPLMMLFAAAFAYDSLSKLGYLGEDTSGILPQYSEFGSGGSLPEFRRGDILPQHFMGLRGRFAGAPKDVVSFSKNDTFFKEAKSTLKDEPFPFNIILSSIIAGSRYILGPALLGYLAASTLNPKNNRKSSDTEKLLALLAGSELALYPTKGKSLGPLLRGLAGGYGAYQLLSIPMLFDVIGDEDQSTFLRSLALLSVYPALVGGYEFGKMGITGQFERTGLIDDYVNFGTPKTGEGISTGLPKAIFGATKALATYLGPFIIAAELERQKKEREEKQRGKYRGYASGGILQAGGLAKGPSHQSGMVGYAKGGMPFLFEGGEYILSKDATNSVGIDYLDMLNSMGSGGVIPSFETSGPIPDNFTMYGRRDLFGMRTIQTTADDGSVENVNIMNVKEFADNDILGENTNDLLFGISEILFSLYSSDGLGMGSFIPKLEEATAAEKKILTELGILVKDESGNEQMLISDGLLTRTQIDLFSPYAIKQLADVMLLGATVPLQRVVATEEEISKFSQEYKELYFQPKVGFEAERLEDIQIGGIGYYQEMGALTEKDLASSSFIVGFSTMALDQLSFAISTGFAMVLSVQSKVAAREAQQEKSGKGGIGGSATPQENMMLAQMGLMGAFSGMGAGLGSWGPYGGIGAGGMGYGPSVLAVAGTVAGRNTAEEGKQDQSTAGALAGGALGGAVLGPWGAAIGASLGAELAGKPNKYFKDFDGQALVEPFQGLADGFKELEGTGVVNYLQNNVPDLGTRLTEGFDNFGDYLSDTAFAGAGTGVRETLDEIQKNIEELFADPGAALKHVLTQINQIVPNEITEILEKVKEFLQFPARVITQLSNTVGSLVDKILSTFFGEIPGHVRKIIVDMTKGFFNLPVAFVDQLSSGAIAKSLEMLGGIVLKIAYTIVDIPVEIIKKFSKDVLGTELSDKFSGESVVNTIINLPFNLLNKFMEEISGGKKEDSNGGIIPMPQVLKDAFGWTEKFLIPLKIGGLDLSGAASGDLFPTLSPSYEVFQRGGLAIGPSHANGGIPGVVGGVKPIEFEGGEYIINKKTVDLLGTGFFNYVNSIKNKKFASGGSIEGSMSEIDKIAKINKEKERAASEKERIAIESKVKEKNDLVSSTAFSSYKKGDGWGSTKTLPDILLNQELTIGGTLGEALKKIPVIGFNSARLTLPTYDFSKAFFGTEKKELGGYLFSDGGGVRLGREPMRRKDGTVIRDRNGNILYHTMMDAPGPGGEGGLTFAPNDIRGKMLGDKDKMRIRRYEDAVAVDKKVKDSMGSATVKSGKKRLFGFGPDRIDAAIASSLGLMANGGLVEKFFIGGSAGQIVTAATNTAKQTVNAVAQTANQTVNAVEQTANQTANFDFLDPEAWKNAAERAAKTAADLGKQIQDKIGVDLTKVDFKDLKTSDFGVIESIVGKEALEFLITVTEYDYIKGFEEAWAIIEYLYDKALPKLEWSMGVDLGNLKNPIGTSGRGIFYGLGGPVPGLGVSMPSVLMENGGYVSGLPHYLGGVLAELEGGEFVINKSSAEDIGRPILNDLNSNGSGGFVTSLVQSSFVTNDLLRTLIQVTENKDMNVTVVDEGGNEKSDSKLMIGRDREMAYRGARMLA